MPTDADRERGPARPGDGAARPKSDLARVRAALRSLHDLVANRVDMTDGPAWNALEEAHSAWLWSDPSAAPPAAHGAAAGDRYLDGYADGARVGEADARWRRDNDWCGALLMLVHYDDFDRRADKRFDHDERKAAAWDFARRLAGTLPGFQVLDERAPASALPGAEAVAEALTSKQMAKRLRERLSHTQGVYLGPSTCANLIAYVLTGLEPGDRRDTGVAAILARLARPDAPEGPVLAGAVRADKVRAYLDAADRYIAEVGQWGPGRDRQPVIEARDAALKARADLDGDLRAALDGGAGGGWRPIETAPYDQEVEVRVGAMRFRAKLVRDASIDSEGASCDQWQATREGEHPPSWTDGACWESNADGSPSLQPDGWRPVPAPPSSGQRGGDDGAR